MKHVVSVSLGSSKRDKSVKLKILGEEILIERIGTDGDLDRAAKIIQDFDGKVDALGLGGADLGMMVDGIYYPLYSVNKIRNLVKKTPLLDGMGLKNTLESRVSDFLEQNLNSWLDQHGRKVLLVSSVSRWAMAQSFIDAGYSCTFGDLMFSLGIPIPIRSRTQILRIISLLCPVVTRLPFSWIYPIGEEKPEHKPKFTKYYRDATVIAGDCLYIKDAIPLNMDGRIIVTNTTTESDVELFRRSGIKYIITTTPVYEGRTFGTNVMEAVITAYSGKKAQLTNDELEYWINKLNIKPQIREIN
jgi:hypothetical protein